MKVTAEQLEALKFVNDEINASLSVFPDFVEVDFQIDGMNLKDFIEANTPKPDVVEKENDKVSDNTMTKGRSAAGVDFSKSQGTRSAKTRVLTGDLLDYLFKKVDEFSENEFGYSNADEKVEYLEDAIDLVKQALDKAISGFKLK